MSTSDAKTDDSKLVTTDTVYVSPDDGTTDEAFPKPNVEYNFCVDVANAGDLPSGSFFVRFNLSGDQDPPLDLDFTQDASSAPEKPINCAGSFDITVNTESTSDSGSGSSDDSSASTEPEDSGSDSTTTESQ